MHDIQVIEDPATAAVALEPTRSRILSELAEPASAATVAMRVGLARQPHEAAGDWADRVGNSRPDLAASLQLLTKRISGFSTS